ncbi:Katanin p60 ATPase-containing subunit A-like 2 [Larimichthys crocea]|uniref:Uncharacterized protein n=1 Tax=Larimichthys crocea TaxID=215358 RepID=A0ACD3QN82_LARCR|nr:Katanin p60 ATPase-containing subunit A-like 2 [Larimichthys crocea]
MDALGENTQTQLWMQGQKNDKGWIETMQNDRNQNSQPQKKFPSRSSETLYFYELFTHTHLHVREPRGGIKTLHTAHRLQKRLTNIPKTFTTSTLTFHNMMELSYQSMKIAHQAREADELRTEMRKKSLLILIYQHLLGQGYVAAAMALDQETNGGVRKFEVCDNIDLEMVLMEYESYHYVKFQKYPKLMKKTCRTRSPCSAVKPLPKSTQPKAHSLETEPKKTAASSHTNENGSSLPPESSEFGLNVSSIKNGPTGEAAMNRKMTDGKGSIHDAVRGAGSDSDHMERLLKPLSGFSGMSGEMRELAAIISRDIYLHSPNVRWEDIIGLEDAKRLVKEAVVYPIKYPQLFTGILSPWKACCSMAPQVQVRRCWPRPWLQSVRRPSSTSQPPASSASGEETLRNWSGGEHEGSRRMKTELLVQMDGLARSEDLVFVLAASNLPWELDHAMLRRLEKRILVSLPSSPARQAMVSHWLPPLTSTGGVELRTELDYETLAKGMEGYSGSDIRLVCKEAAMRPVRKIFDALESHQDGDTDMPAIQLETVTTADFLEVTAHTKPSARNLMKRYAAWEREYESV